MSKLVCKKKMWERWGAILLTKIIKCLLLTILICVVMIMLVMGIELLKNTLSVAVVLLIFFSVVVFGTVFVLVWTTLY